MKAFFIFLIIALILGGLARLVIRDRRLRKERDFERMVQARKLGWMYSGTPNGRIDYRFSGSNHGIEWSMWHDSDRGDESPKPEARWETANVLAPRLSMVIMGRKRYQMESSVAGRMLMDIVTGVAHAVSDRGQAHDRPEKSVFYETAVRLEAGPASFRARFAVAVGPDMPHAWFDESLQKLLLNWPRSKRSSTYKSDEKIEIALSQHGLKITAQQMPEDFAFWNHLAQLGQTLALRLGHSANT